MNVGVVLSNDLGEMCATIVRFIQQSLVQTTLSMIDSRVYYSKYALIGMYIN